ncbi:hypothetical protein [Rhizobium johnstonii]|uniref:hypothetical protein n=1 Tax=Rhizobium johnstonii TaxID=3019933 RepID=UPI003F9E29EA
MTPCGTKISIVTAHGRREIKTFAGERLVDTLRRNGVPWSAISIYGIRENDEKAELLSGLGKTIESFSEFSELRLYFNRNVNPFLFSLDAFNETGPEKPGEHETEFFYQVMANDDGVAHTTLAKLSPADCLNIVATRVKDVVTQHVEPGAIIVVGVSGGGDSNAMLYGLSKAAEAGLDIRPIIAKGIPDWDVGVPRARELCEKYGLELTVLEETEMRELMGVPVDGLSLVERFEREFVGDDFEFLGTLMIRVALSKFADRIGTKYICTGLNLEDVVCEQMFRISSGMKPAAIPARVIGDKTLLMPLWMCPKRIIDGCFPRFSIANYEARYPCFSLGRNLYYSVVYNLQSTFPNYIETMAKGLSKLAEADPVEYKFDVGLGVHVERFVPMPLRRQFISMLGSTIR